jgi:beta-galactosidase/beta-glucuronidase
LTFFNYAGIDRSDIIYSTPTIRIEDIIIDTQTINFDSQHQATSATLNYSIVIAGSDQTNILHVLVQLSDANGVVVANNNDTQPSLIVNKPNLWGICKRRDDPR